MMTIVGASLLAKAVQQFVVHRLLCRFREQARSHRYLSEFQASGIFRKPTAKRFQPLMALIATVKSTISLGVKCSLSNS